MNGQKIVNAFRENLDNRKNLIKKEKVIGEQFSEISNTIQEIMKIYLVAFKNLDSKKQMVCKVEDIFNRRTQYYYDDSQRDKIKEVLLFLNKDGFSLSNSIREDDKSASKHIHQHGDDKDFIRGLKRIVKYKNEIWAKIKMPIKKERFGKFVKAFEDNNLDLTLDYFEDYHYFTTDINKLIEFYDRDKINKEYIKGIYIETNNVSCIRLKDKKRDYSTTGQIQLDEMEKIEQIYDEVVVFLDTISKKQEELKTNLHNFKEKLVEDFARELIIDKMDKEAREDKNR